MRHLTRSIVSLFLPVLFITACSTQPGSPASVQQNTRVPLQPTAGQAQYDDAFAYCAAVGTIDSPDARYSGPVMPDSIVQGMVKQGIVSADAPPNFQNSAVWRCMNGQVWVCHLGANLPCQEKADLSQTPTSTMQDFCTANPTSDVIPAAVTGRATVYEWKCKAGKPEPVQQIFKVDPQGYLVNFWYELTK